MNTHKFMLEKMRFHLNDPDTLVFVGWFYDGTTKNHTLTVQLDGKELEVKKTINKGVEICQKYVHALNEISEEVVGTVTLPENWREGRRLTIQSAYEGRTHRDAVYSVKALRRLENKIEYHIDNVRKKDSKLIVSGWCLAGGVIKFSFLDAQKQPLPAEIDSFDREDTEREGPDDEQRKKRQFSAKTDAARETAVYFKIEGKSAAELVRLSPWTRAGKFAKLCAKIKKAVSFFKRNGIKATLVRVMERLFQGRNATYEHWRKKYAVTAQELEQQKALQSQFQIRPKFSIAVALYQTEEVFLRELLDSVQNQTYDNWELCLADGSEDNGQKLMPIIEEYQKKDSRICYRVLEKNFGISQNTNEAMKMASGDFVAFADHDDTLSLDALFEFAKAINEEPSVEVLYSDEDKLDSAGKKYCDPHFKPDFDLDFLLTNNYICHFLAVKRELLNKTGEFRSEYDGSQDYDFILRCCENAERICHVPKILYHWRFHFDSTAGNPQSKLYAFEAGRRALEAHYERLKIPAKVEHAQFYGLYRTRYQWDQTPLVSVVIPNRDHVKELAGCVESLRHSRGCNYEIIIVEHGSSDPETFAYYEACKKEQDQIRVITYEGEASAAKLNNYGANAAAGEYLLLLDPRTRLLDSDCINELLGYCMRKDVGVAGAKIIDADDRIFHAGIVLGIHQTMGYVFRGKSRYTAGYESRILCAQNYSAVSSMCMMMKRELYQSIGGMKEDCADDIGAIDVCLKVRSLGLLVVYNPYAELLYDGTCHGAKSGNDRVVKDAEAFLASDDRSGRMWKKIIEEGDPYYNPNLTVKKLDFSIRK